MIEVREAPREHYPWIAKRANLIITTTFYAIEAVLDHRILAMVGYDAWTPNSCSMHVAIDEPIAVRKMIKPAFAIPFKELGRGVVTGSVLSTNTKALAFDKHLGFKEVGFIPDGFQPGVGIHILMMRREECRWLGA